MKTFYKLLSIALLVVTTNNFVWFALTYWAYLTTHSVISTSIMAGVFLVMSALSSFWLGAIVDHYKKKKVMLASSIITVVLFIVGLVLFMVTPFSTFASVSSIQFWLLVIILLAGTIVGSLYNIAIPTLVAMVVPEPQHARANGMFGTIIGISFGITAVISGLALGYGGMDFVLKISIATGIIGIIWLALTRIDGDKVVHATHETEDNPKRIDLLGTFKVVRSIPGLLGLIFFSTFNNFLGGVFFALMDAYGLSLVSVETWGILWGFISTAFIFGGLYVAKRGLGERPLWTLFRNNMVTWAVCVVFTIQPSIVLLAIGTFIWMFFGPFTEAIEQTILQKVVPLNRLGRVFGFSHSVEQAASPLTAFFIGPIAQFIFIPFMTTGAGVDWIGSWYGTGTGRGIGLVFSWAGLIGLIVTFIAWHSKSYHRLSSYYKTHSPTDE